MWLGIISVCDCCVFKFKMGLSFASYGCSRGLWLQPDACKEGGAVCLSGKQNWGIKKKKDWGMNERFFSKYFLLLFVVTTTHLESLVWLNWSINSFIVLFVVKVNQRMQYYWLLANIWYSRKQVFLDFLRLNICKE